ncbi:MAG: isoprenylcysteine carboxylmethyltransferase family protein [Propionicimonas sp.]
MRKYLEWARRDYSTRQLVVALFFAGTVFLLAIPYLIIVSSAGLDQALGLPRFIVGIINPIVGGLFLLGGGLFAFWSVLAEARIGSGTPLPMMPTQRLVVVPPFTYCRNPMVLGTLVAYLGVGVWLGSLSAIAIVITLGGLLLTYVKLLEEKELEARFGDDYLEYKRGTPFLLPRVTRRPPHL